MRVVVVVVMMVVRRFSRGHGSRGVLIVPNELDHILLLPRLLRRAQLHQLYRLALLRHHHHGRLPTTLMTEQLLPEPDEPPAPTALLRSVVPWGSRKEGRLLPALLPGAPAPEPNDDEEDERTAQRHEKDLPPLKGTFARSGGGIDARYGRQRCRCAGSRWLGDVHELGKTYP